MPMKTLSKPMKTRRYNRACRLRNASGTKARTGVASTGHAKNGTSRNNFTPRLAEEDSTTVALRRSARCRCRSRLSEKTSRCGRGRGEYDGDEVVLDEDVEGGEPATTRGGQTGCLDGGVVGGTYDSQEWPCRLPVEMWRRCSK
jgi:hypothetical protein